MAGQEAGGQKNKTSLLLFYCQYLCPKMIKTSSKSYNLRSWQESLHSFSCSSFVLVSPVRKHSSQDPALPVPPMALHRDPEHSCNKYNNSLHHLTLLCFQYNMCGPSLRKVGQCVTELLRKKCIFWSFFDLKGAHILLYFYTVVCTINCGVYN